jgi:hypothetical protein
MIRHRGTIRVQLDSPLEVGKDGMNQAKNSSSIIFMMPSGEKG